MLSSTCWRILTTAVLLTATSAEVSAAELWKLVANSQIIASGKLSVPREQIVEFKKSGNDQYVELSLRLKKCLKGPCASELVIRYFTGDRAYSPAAQSLFEQDGKATIVFLATADDERLYFAGYTPDALRPDTERNSQEVVDEIAAQTSALAGFAKNFNRRSDPMFGTVRRLVNDFTNPREQQLAFAELEKLGDKAVPSMIALMDDRRDLAIPQISLKNNFAGAFEGVRHYGPEKVVDAIAALLSQITGQSFGEIHNGGSEAQRQAAVNGWRIFLAHQPGFDGQSVSKQQ